MPSSDLFPYNHHHGRPEDCKNYECAQGTPLTYPKALDIIEDWYFWHNQLADTDMWTQSNDGAHSDMHFMALGLLAFAADPTYMVMLEAIGRDVSRRCDTLWRLYEMKPDEYKDDAHVKLLIEAKIGRFADISKGES